MAETVKHTRGIWEWTMTRGGSFHKALGSRHENGYEPVIYVEEYAGSAWMEITEANARLIAAAPELLEMAKWAESALSPFSRDPAEKSGIAKLRAAIAKAEGRTDA